MLCFLFSPRQWADSQSSHRRLWKTWLNHGFNEILRQSIRSACSIRDGLTVVIHCTSTRLSRRKRRNYQIKFLSLFILIIITSNLTRYHFRITDFVSITFDFNCRLSPTFFVNLTISGGIKTILFEVTLLWAIYFWFIMVICFMSIFSY